MKKNIVILSVLMFIMTMISCKKDPNFNGLSDNRPTIPVTVTNAIDFRPEPTVSTSIAAGGPIQIVLAIPPASGRTIKEITKVAESTSYSQIQSTGTTGFYTAGPIPVNSTTYTFNTTLAEYVSKGATLSPKSVIPPVSTTVGTELARKFYFMITLDDGTVIIPEPVRVLVTN